MESVEKLKRIKDNIDDIENRKERILWKVNDLFIVGCLPHHSF